MRTSGESFFQRKQQKEKVLISDVPDVARSGVSRSHRAIVKTEFYRDLLEKSGFWSAIV